MEKDLPTKQNDSVLDNLTDIFGSLSDVETGKLLNYEIVKEIPIISNVISICKAVNGIRERSYIKKLEQFIQAVNNGIATNKQIDCFKAKATEDKKKLDKEITYLLIIIDRFLDEHKPEMLAKVYLAYIDKNITWNELTVMAEIIDRLLPGDYKMLSSNYDYCTFENNESDCILRLIGLGLIIKDPNEEHKQTLHQKFIERGLATGPNDEEIIKNTYVRTALGQKIINIVEKSYNNTAIT